MILFADSPDKFINSYSSDFKKDFLNLLSRRFGTRRVGANTVYQEYISDRNHLHMNATIWNTLTDFVKYLGKEGICEVEETEKGWFIKWIDRRPETLARQEAFLRRERSERDEEEREQRQILEQIERAKNQSNYKETIATELKRTNSEEKIKLDLSIKQAPKTGFKLSSSTKPAMGLKGLVKKNALKEAAKKISEDKKTVSEKTPSDSNTNSSAPKYSSNLDLLMKGNILGKKDNNKNKNILINKFSKAGGNNRFNGNNNDDDNKDKKRKERDEVHRENKKEEKSIENHKRSSSYHRSHRSRSRSRSRSTSREHKHSSGHRHHRSHSHDHDDNHDSKRRKH